jgi:hypothetical protein
VVGFKQFSDVTDQGRRRLRPAQEAHPRYAPGFSGQFDMLQPYTAPPELYFRSLKDCRVFFVLFEK